MAFIYNFIYESTISIKFDRLIGLAYSWLNNKKMDCSFIVYGIY
jgi:hypothetical protein